jgi:transposase
VRGEDQQQSALFSYISPEERVPKDHPLRPIRAMCDEVLKGLSPRFEGLYSHTGRPSIAPERLLRALLLQMFYTIRSERLLMEELDYNLLFRWFVGLGTDDAVWDATVFSKNRDRLLAGDVAAEFFELVVKQARERGLLSDEHFTVDGTLIEAWASLKSFKAKGAKRGTPPEDPGNPTVDFHGEKRSNRTHESTTDPESRLLRKGPGKEAKLSYMGHVVMENRNGLAVAGCVTQATGRAEWDAAVTMLESGKVPRASRITVAADKGYDQRFVVEGLRRLGATPHVAQKVRGSAIDGRVVRHEGYAISQRKRKRVEEIFGWLKTVGTMRKARHRGTHLVGWMFTFALAAFNLVRIRNLIEARA